MSEEVLLKLKAAVAGIEEETILEITKELLEKDVPPLEIIDQAISPGMAIVGEKFNAGEYYLPELMMSADAVNGAMEILEPEILRREEDRVQKGKVVIGSAQGDIHSIGKDIVGMLMKTRGFEVYDLGVDVPASAFMKKAKEVNANIVAISALLTTTMPSQGELIELLRDVGLRDRYKVMVGGGPVNQEWADEIGADGYADNADHAVRKALELMGATD